MLIIKAEEAHLPAIIQLLAQDPLGAKREDNSLPLPTAYLKAFNLIIQDANQHLMVMLDENQQVVGTLQLSFIQYLTYQGGVRAQIEAVRISSSQRGQGLGRMFFEWAIQKANDEGAHVLQLTTDKQRPEALKFYEELGFKASHEGMKLHLN